MMFFLCVTRFGFRTAVGSRAGRTAARVAAGGCAAAFLLHPQFLCTLFYSSRFGGIRGARDAAFRTLRTLCVGDAGGTQHCNQGGQFEFLHSYLRGYKTGKAFMAKNRNAIDEEQIRLTAYVSVSSTRWRNRKFCLIFLSSSNCLLGKRTFQ